ncbi:MAG: hypothetical protein HY958_09470 [Bacteroidia bacterium]|nr:hypothetical protein [Bacteroidia bacterium]
MKKYFQFLLILSALSVIPFWGNAQCKNFAKKAKIDLLPFIHDGIYNATVLSEGETAELYKTFYSGQQYRIAVVAEETMPKVEFKVMDSKRKVLYSNKEKGFAKTWDFTLESSQQLIIAIQVQTVETLIDEIAKGCVTVLVGFMNEEDKIQK